MHEHTHSHDHEHEHEHAHDEHDHDHDDDMVDFDVPPHIVEAATAIVLNPEELADKEVYAAAAAMLTSIFEAHT